MKRPSTGQSLRPSARVRVNAGPVQVPARPLADDDGRKGIQSVDIAFSIVRVLEGAGKPLSLREIARLAGQQPSKVHHYLVSLVRNRIAVQNSAGDYDLGAYALQLGLSALSRVDAIERSVEQIVAFRDETGESAFVAVWGNRGPTIIRYVNGARPITVEVRAGLVLPVLSSATGHVFLTWLPDSVWAPVVQWEMETAEKLPSPVTPKSVAAIRDRTLRRGLASIDGDLLPRIAAVSAPVFGHDGSLVCALTSLGWRGELDTSADSETARKLLAASQALSKAIGFAGNQGE